MRPPHTSNIASALALALALASALACSLLRAGAAHAAGAPGAPVSTPVTIEFATCQKPEWPRESLQNEETGTATLAYLVGEDGAVIDGVIRKSSGFAILDKAALDGMRRCQFTPASIGGVRSAAWLQMQYVWELNPVEAEFAQAAPLVASYLKAAAAGDVDAHYQLALLYRTHANVEGNAELSRKAMRLAAMPRPNMNWPICWSTATA